MWFLTISQEINGGFDTGNEIGTAVLYSPQKQEIVLFCNTETANFNLTEIHNVQGLVHKTFGKTWKTFQIKTAADEHGLVMQLVDYMKKYCSRVAAYVGKYEFELLQKKSGEDLEQLHKFDILSFFINNFAFINNALPRVISETLGTSIPEKCTDLEREINTVFACGELYDRLELEQNKNFTSF